MLIDLSKAFDLVNHDILLQKLSLYGIQFSTLDWFKSYLNFRTQKTFISGKYSGPGNVLAGVPQGSVLGPLLFLIYINDLPLSLSHSIADIFADDTTLTTHSKSLDHVIFSLTRDLLHADQWCKLNQMSINSKKSKVLFITSKRNKKQIVESNINIPFQGNSIEATSSAKLLGITINDSLSWADHINNVIKKCNSYLYLLSRIKNFLSIETRKRFYNAYILPHFDFCCIIWGNCTSSLEDKLIKFQKRAARVILDSDYSTPSTALFSKLKWMTFHERVIYQKAIQMYKTLRGDAPDYLQNAFTFTTDIHSRLLRSSSTYQLYSPKPNTELFRHTFVFSGTSIWNSIPLYIKNSTSIQHFKTLYLRWVKPSYFETSHAIATT